MRLPSKDCDLAKATILPVIYMFLDFMQDTTAIPSMIIWTALNMQGYVEEKYTLCCVV